MLASSETLPLEDLALPQVRVMLRLTLTSSLTARRELGEDSDVGEFYLLRHPFLRLQAGDPLLGGWAPLQNQGI